MKLHRTLGVFTLALLLATSACSAQDSSSKQTQQAQTTASAQAGAQTSQAADAPATEPVKVASAATGAGAPPAGIAAPGQLDASMYTTLPSPVPSQAPPGKVEVIEFFLYTCPHCNHFEPIVTPWSKNLPAYIDFKRVPAAFGPHADMYAHAHYAAIDLNVLDKFRPALFHALHVERRNITTLAQLTELFTQATGVDAKAFTDAYNSFAVDNQVRRAKALNQAYRVTGVPCLGVAGKYLVTTRTAKSFEGMLKVADALSKQEHQAPAKP